MVYQKICPTNLNPVNIFHVWYTELCRRANNSPSPNIKIPSNKCQTVLDFIGDRLKIDEWNPLIKALRSDNSLHVIKIKSRINNCQFLYDIDTEDKLRVMKRRYGILWTDYIIQSLLKSLSCVMKNTTVLTFLEFDGIPLFDQYLEMLMKALQNNKTLKILSLAKCPINDNGCQIVCNYLRTLPNIDTLNLSNCGLTSKSGEYIAKLIKYQQIKRYCETWQNSLRYSDPNVHIMGGLKRITLNRNPNFNDKGLDFILNELIDDLWIKALDLQKCGITDNLSQKILQIVENNQSLEILDFRLNNQLDINVMQKVLNILKERQIDKEPEFQWCNTTATLSCYSTYDTITNRTITTRKNRVQKVEIGTSKQNNMKNRLQKVASVPIKPMNMNYKKNNLRKTKSVPVKTKQQQEQQQDTENYQIRLQEEINRRLEVERMNQELMQKLDENTKISKLQANNSSNDFISLVVNMASKFTLEDDYENTNIPYKNGYQEPSIILKEFVNNLHGDSDGSNMESFVTYAKNENEVNDDGDVLI